MLLPLCALDLGKPLLHYATAAHGTYCYPYLWVIVTVLLDRIFVDAQGNPILSVARCRGYPFRRGYMAAQADYPTGKEPRGNPGTQSP